MPAIPLLDLYMYMCVCARCRCFYMYIVCTPNNSQVEKGCHIHTYMQTHTDSIHRFSHARRRVRPRNIIYVRLDLALTHICSFVHTSVCWITADLSLSLCKWIPQKWNTTASPLYLCIWESNNKYIVPIFFFFLKLDFLFFSAWQKVSTRLLYIFVDIHYPYVH